MTLSYYVGRLGADRALSPWPNRIGLGSRPAATEYGARLRAARLERGWGLRAAALRCGVAKSTLSEIELGQQTPSPEVAARLARAFQVDALGEGR